MATATAKSATSRKPEQSVELREFTNTVGVGAAVNRDTCTITGLKILGPESRNKRHYSESLRRSTAHLYEGVPAYFDHLKPGAERSYADCFGHWSNIRALPEGTFGDLKYNPKHPMAEAVLHDIENGTKGVGCSPDHYGNGPVGRDGKRMVESITVVKSIDIVANPATNRSFSESTNEGNADMAELAEQLTEALTKVSTLATEKQSLAEQVTKLTEQVSTLVGEKSKLQESVDAAAAATKIAEHKAAVVKLLDDNKIAAHLRKPELIAMYEAVDIKAAEAGIKSLAESTKGTVVRSVSGTPLSESKGGATGSTTGAFDPKAFAKGLKG